MKAFRYVRPASFAAAAKACDGAAAMAKAGGSDLLERMKERLATPDYLVALNEVPESGTIRSITAIEGGGVRIGALVTLADIAASDVLPPALVTAAMQAASPQIRHRATLGGNLAQHTRCSYYRLLSMPCWKRGAAACPVLADGAVQDTAGVFTNTSCASAHPSSVAPVLGAAGAVVSVRTAKGVDERPFADLWAAPQKGVTSDLALAPGELIESVALPAWTRVALAYEEVRQRAAFDWALVSCCVGITRAAAGKVEAARIWLGSVAPTPHRAAAAEGALVGSALGDADIEKAAAAAVTGAAPLGGNAYKVELVKVVVRRALRRAAGR